jgi:DNA-directed RNA polymerase specialized sigma24 family protein
VYSFRVPSWRGQEEEIIEDILQETTRRIIERAQKAEAGEALPIYQLEHMVVVTAHNYCKDLRRRDHRIVRLLADMSIPIGEHVMGKLYQICSLDDATEQAYQEELFTLLAREIAIFPCKQRTALLIDLANHMSFGERPTPLQKAFLIQGIHLEEYRQPLSNNQKERSRHAALLCYAYKRITQLSIVREYMTAA